VPEDELEEWLELMKLKQGNLVKQQCLLLEVVVYLVIGDVELVLKDQLELDVHFTEAASLKVLPAQDPICQATFPVFKLVTVQPSQLRQPLQNLRLVEERLEEEEIEPQSS